MEHTRSPQRLGFFLPLRIATYVILTTIVMIWMGDPHYLRLQIISYSVLTLALAAALAVERRWRTAHVTQVVIGLQFVLEVSLESGVIYATGNINSPFSALFVLTIVSAALTFRLAGTLLTASLVSGAYAFIIWLGLVGPDGSELSVQALERAFWAAVREVLEAQGTMPIVASKRSMPSGSSARASAKRHAGRSPEPL